MPAVENENKHLGHLMMEALKKRPDAVCQIDAATGKEETNASVLARSVRLAKSMRKEGLQPGDVMLLGGKNHLDLNIPYYAALFNGLPITGVDPAASYDDIKYMMEMAKPKIAFTEKENNANYERAAKDIGINVKMINYGNGDNSMTKLIENEEAESSVEFEPSAYDGSSTYAWLVRTSGTTGKPKLVAFKHQPWVEILMKCLTMPPPEVRDYYVPWIKTPEDMPNKMAMNISPVGWICSYFHTVGLPVLNKTIVQTSAPNTPENIIDMIHKYKPVQVVCTPPMMSRILCHEKKCDMSSFDSVTFTGDKAYMDILTELRERLPKEALIIEAYGQTETPGSVLTPNAKGPLGSCGTPMNSISVKLIDPESGDEIKEPNKPGEMWTKGARFSEYYNQPEETTRVFSEDGWHMTGDMLYRDEHNNYYYVDRMTNIIMYKDQKVFPVELEEHLRSHPGVEDVAVTGKSFPGDGQRAVAVVVKRSNASVTAAQIKEYVAGKFPENKQLHGGVSFVDEVPRFPNGQIARFKLSQMAPSFKVE